jgi:hypothetical protein
MSTNYEKEIEDHDEGTEQVEEEENLDEETQNRLKNLTIDDTAFQQDSNSKKQKTGKSGKVILALILEIQTKGYGYPRVR